MQSKADDIKERVKYLSDMLAQYADDETVWLDNEDDMEYFADEPVPETTKEADPLPQNIETEVTPETAPPATHPLIKDNQEDGTETTPDSENINKGDALKLEDMDKRIANILADVPSRNDAGDTPAKNKKLAENNPSDRFEKIAKVIADNENTASILPTEMSKTPNVDEKGRKIFKSKATLKILNEMGRKIKIGKLNDSMISKGAPLNACYCILEGYVRYYDSLTNEYLLGEGSLIGAAEVLAPNKIHFDYRTEGYVKVAIIDFSIIKSAIDLSLIHISEPTRPY